MIKRKPAGAGPSGDSPSRRGNGGGSPQPAQLAQLTLVRELARIAAEFELEEIELEPEGRIRISRRNAGSGMSASTSSTHGGASPLLVVSPASAPALTAVEEGALYVTSPFVGTFYRSPSPEAAVFVDVGQDVRKGQVVCIIEAMKLMNEIESEVDGKVTEVLVKNGEHVEYGQPLFRLAKA
jgi:acetyl-CoA carboxylase biotin carboxyl carrier protein